MIITTSTPYAQRPKTAAAPKAVAPKPVTHVRPKLAEVIFSLIGASLLAGGALVCRDIVASSRLLSQVSQIGQFDSATAAFYEKYDGLPGDLLSARAEREGLPAGDGKPSHSDGDGKISPCNPGWQWNFGCETALFWAQLSVTGLISDNFSADSHYSDGLLPTTGVMTPYLPQSPLSEKLSIAVWNSDATQPSPGHPLPYGNYYEISMITGISHGKMRDDEHAITPLHAKALDEKMDDGYPYSGRVMINGTADWPHDAWGSFSHPGKENCISPDEIYNVYDNYFTAHRPLCHIAIQINCCDREDD